MHKQSNDGITALGWAAFWGNAEIARLLLDKGADINTTIAGLEKSASAASERKDNIWAFGTSEAIIMLKDMKR
jgi:ankyrin repeat protein